MVKKVLFITGKLQHYRIPILNLIAQDKNIELTVAHSFKSQDNGNLSFNEVLLVEKKIGPFTIHKNNLLEFCNKFDIVVAMLYLQKISFMRLILSNQRKFKLVFWGIGVKASQKSKFDTPTVLNYVRYHIAKKSDAMIFYTNYAREKYISKGINSHKLFVMPNTVKVINSLKTDSLRKDRIVFVGKLNKSKRIFDLISVYLELIEANYRLPILEIVGNGEDYREVSDFIDQNKMAKYVILHGAIYEEEELEKIYKRSIVSISPGQAGLSVLTSFGYGVPFITKFDAITGGERLNIQNNFNGILYKTQKDLKNIIKDISTNPDKYIRMGSNAKKYYKTKRSPEIMSQGFVNAVNYVTK